MEFEWRNGLVILTLPKSRLVFTVEEWSRAIKRGKSIKRAQVEREREEKRREVLLAQKNS